MIFVWLFLLSSLTQLNATLRNVSYTKDPLEENKDVEVKKGMTLIEGDILIEVITFRSAVRSQTHLWDKRIIPYTIEETFDSLIFDAIQKAISVFHDETCLLFKVRDQEPDFIYFNRQRGCFSSIGRRGGIQEISLDYLCANEGIIIHEIMHALGFWHEHSRYDRDQYIDIMWDNVQKNRILDFTKHSEEMMDLLETSYDYGSIMHYSSTTFAIDKNKPVIIPHDPDVFIGQRVGLSNIDLQRILKLYKCDTKSCDNPDNNPNIISTGADTVNVGESLLYSCLDDFKLIGAPYRYCLFDGSWSGVKPSCEGHYVYIETSRPQSPKDTARIISPHFPQASLYCLNFAYFMYGINMGVINLFLRKNELDTLLWSVSTSRGNKWHTEKFAIKVSEKFQLVFEGIVGDQSTSDAAIDEIILRKCNSDDPDIIEILSFPILSCDFEGENECGWIQDENGFEDVFDWLRNSGSTSTEGTGPDNDHTLGNENGHYLYLETSFPRISSENAVIRTPIFTSDETICLKFFYHMYGSDIGSLNVYLFIDDNKSLLWSLSGSQVHEWKEVSITVEQTGTMQIAFEGITGDGNRGDIAIDDINVWPGLCS